MIYVKYSSLYLISVLILLSLLVFSCAGTNKNLSPQGIILSQKKLELPSFNLSVNGERIQEYQVQEKQKEIFGTDALIFGAKKYGIFVVSTEPFKKSKKAGSISSDGINFEINDLKVLIESDDDIFLNTIEEELPIWVRRMHNRKSETFTFDTQPYSSLNNSSFIEKLPWPEFPVAQESNNESNIHLIKETAPQIIGGLSSISKRVKYPKQAKENNVTGVVRIEFKVGEDGNIYDFKFLNRIGAGCDREALYAIKASKFKPAEVDGYPSPSKIMIPIYFK